MNFLPKELEDIIGDYKNKMEDYEEQYKVLDKLFYNYSEEAITKKINMSYQDFKDYCLRNWINHNIKVRVGLYDNPRLDNSFYDLDIRNEDDECLNNFDIIEICIYCQTIYLDFGDYERNQERIPSNVTLSFTEDIDEDDDLEVDISGLDLV